MKVFEPLRIVRGLGFVGLLGFFGFVKVVRSSRLIVFDRVVSAVRVC